MKKGLFFLGLVLLFAQAQAREPIRALFQNNAAIIYTINIRNFAAKDKDLDGLIDPSSGDKKGTFLSAIEKLPELKREGINVIYLLPVTPVGKLKALGTSGSLYALGAFDEINPELDDENNPKSAKEEARDFVAAAHKLDMNVIVDLPACACYDLTLKKPDWFKKDAEGKALVVADWTDVRLLDINEELINNTKKFVDMAQEIGFDGIRADVAAIKPKEFWSEIIKYARSKNEDFLFLAEANPDWDNPAKEGVERYSSVDELLDSGFDSYYGSWSDFKSLKSADELADKLENNFKIIKKHKASMISALATHDQPSPVLRGKNYWNSVLWLCVALPQNTYFLDGFSVGDDYLYPYENKPAKKTSTDYDKYFVHKGQFDIFNPAAPVRAKHPRYKQTYIKAINFKKQYHDLINSQDFKIIKTDNDKIFAYSNKLGSKELLVLFSLDDENRQSALLKSNNLKGEYLFSIITGLSHPKIDKDTINASLEPNEIQIYIIEALKSEPSRANSPK